MGESLMRFVQWTDFAERGTEKCWRAMLQSCFVEKAINSTGHICCGVFFGVGRGRGDVVELGCVDLSYMGREEFLQDEVIVRHMAVEFELFLFTRFQ
jgi:hypothetical protein